MDPEIECLLESILNEARADNRFQALHRPGLTTWPVPFFGRITEADVLTVGVNPSWTEFNNPIWTRVTNIADCRDRLLTYFEGGNYHAWFSPWEKALEAIDCSYRPGKHFLAAHIDLSPRATTAMGSIDDEGKFVEMVRNDLKYFIATLRLSRRVKLLLLAGTVTGQYYMNEFLMRCLPEHQIAFDGSFSRFGQSGPGKTSYHWVNDGRRIPAFFCTCSPSSRNPELLVQRVQENRQPLLQRLSHAAR